MVSCGTGKLRVVVDPKVVTSGYCRPSNLHRPESSTPTPFVAAYLLGLLTFPILIGVLGVLYLLIELLEARGLKRRDEYRSSSIGASSAR